MRPCPFCGCATILTFHYSHLDRPWVCECVCCLTKGPHGDTEEDAKKLWDVRSSMDVLAVMDVKR